MTARKRCLSLFELANERLAAIVFVACAVLSACQSPTAPSVSLDRPLPPPVTPTSPPQAAGADVPHVEIAGNDSIRTLLVGNASTDGFNINPGEWFEPKDGTIQRMLVVRGASVPSGRTVSIDVVCMQVARSIPPSGLRFFSRAKAPAGRVQQCQDDCLRLPLSQVQSCVWRCE